MSAAEAGGRGARPRTGPLRHAGRAGSVAGVLVVLVFLALLVFGLVARAPRTGIDDLLAQSRPAPAPPFAFEVLERGAPGPRFEPRLSAAFADGRLSSAELRGTPYVLNFWASWCVPCRIEAPVLERGWQDAKRRGVLFVGLNMQDVRSDARAFLREFRVGYPTIREPARTAADAYGVTGLPETFFVTATGRVVGHVIGVVSAAQLRAGVRAAQTGRVMGAGQGGATRPVR